MNTCENNLINPNWDEHGYIQVYTGNGKGKTTASLGLAMRALGRCWKVLIVMFTKGGDDYGELNSFMNLAPTIKDNLKIIQAGTDRVIYKDNKNADDEKSIAFCAGSDKRGESWLAGSGHSHDECRRRGVLYRGRVHETIRD